MQSNLQNRMQSPMHNSLQYPTRETVQNQIHDKMENLGLIPKKQHPFIESLKKIWKFVLAVLVHIKNGLEKLGIQFAPLHVPHKRRFQVMAASGWIIYFMFGEIISTLFTVYLLRTSYFWILLIYIIIIGQQRDTCTYGKNSWNWVRNWSWWHHLKDYFPIKLVKTVDLDPNRNYLFCLFPHGFLSTGGFVNFATDATGFKGLFPGMKSHMVTLGGHFLVPFFREILIWLGIVGSSHDALDRVLDKKYGTGKCAALVIGGAAESLNCHPGLYKVVLRKRKGFIKLAMKHGTPLVPVISFGETEIYEQFDNPEGSLFRHFQDWVRQTTGVAPILPLGRGLFQYSIGILPMRKKITTVVGKPIEVPRNLDPTDEEVDAIHSLFMQSLQSMFDREKLSHLPHQKDAQLIIV